MHAQKKYDQFMDDSAIVQGEFNEKSFQDDMIAQSYDGKAIANNNRILKDPPQAKEEGREPSGWRRIPQPPSRRGKRGKQGGIEKEKAPAPQ